MSQGSLNVPTVGPVNPAVMAADMNTAVDALLTKNSGASAPANFPTTSGGAPTAFQEWADTSPGGGLIDTKVYDGSNWLITGSIDQTGHFWMPKIGGSTDSIASAGTVDIGSKRSAVILITGSVPGTPITSFGNNALLTTGETKFIRFSAAGIVTYNATTMILPGAADLPFNAGDTMQAVYLGSGNWLAYDYRSNVSPVGRNTGDLFEKWGTGVIPGSVRANGNTIGNASSGGTERAAADSVNLFIFLYINDTSLTVSGGRTAPGNTRAAAITDFNLNKTITLPTLFPSESRPTRQYLLSGTTYNTPAGCSLIIARGAGGGGGGGGSGGGGAGGTGGATTFNGISANGGGGGAISGSGNAPGLGGTGGSGSASLRLAGGDGGSSGADASTGCGGDGGNSVFGGGGRGRQGAAAGGTGKANTGGGGGGAGNTGGNGGGQGGGSGEYMEIIISNPASSYSYAIGTAGSAGSGTSAGGGGATGIIIVDEFYSGGANATKYLAL